MGRGTLDMKAGVAAGMIALLHARQHNWRGNVILAAVADEEANSIGTRDMLATRWHADAAVITEPTGLRLGVAHQGFIWAKVQILGVAAHGSRPESGVDAIMKAALFLNALQGYAKSLPEDETLGKASLHCGIIQGGEEPSTIPATCSMTLEFRTNPSQTSETVLRDLKTILQAIAETDDNFKFAEPVIELERPAYRLALDDTDNASLMSSALSVAEEVLGKTVKSESLPGWCDAALLYQAGIPTLILGPDGEGLHSKEEWVEVESIKKTEQFLDLLIERYCA
jgi:acetylornithine deacetylase/succinyl-diaminopimelate desuccinylase-like protein